MEKDRFVTVHSRPLNLWLSAVQSHIHAQDPQAGRRIRQEWVLAHEMFQGARLHVVRQYHKQPITRPDPSAPKAEIHAYLSYLYFEQAQAKLRGDAQTHEVSLELIRDYSQSDILGWATCGLVYLYYSTQLPGPLYNSWQQQGNGNINYSVVTNTLANDAKVAIIGDWGTGMSDAQALVEQILVTFRPAVLIHVGDIYYSGTSDECTSHVLELLQTVFQKVGFSIPVYTLAGNHDYYALGTGYYPLISQLNAYTGWLQQASYFCLRTQDQQWQFEAMDTGYNDDNPFSFFNSDSEQGPALRSDEVAWHQDKLTNFPGRTILLSHHQLFSCHSQINGSDTGLPPYSNTSLYNTFSPYFGKIDAWIWGHEHCYAQYADGTLELAKGRLVGCSGYEAEKSENAYSVNYSQIPYKPGMVQLGIVDGFYNHGCAIIDLKRATPTGPITISYYQFPSWGSGKTPSVLPALTHLNSELIGQTTTQVDGIMGSQVVNFEVPASTQSTNSATVTLSPPPGTATAIISLTAYDAEYTNNNQYGMGELQVGVEASGNCTSATVTMTLRDNNLNKRQWQGSASALVLFMHAAT